MFAKNIWIHAVGIDERNPTQNYASFYRSAADFNEKCDKEKSAQCHLFINNEPQYRSPNYNSFPENIHSMEILPKGQSYQTYIQNKLIKAKSGDTVIISLENHGAPVLGGGSSCIWMNSKDYICDTDIAEILKSKPAGVKVVVSGDACFSGGFAQLSSSEVCTITSASRLNYGYVQSRSLWNAISERHPHKLSDLREPIVAESGRQKLLGSQVIMQQLCEKARAKLSDQDKQSLLLVNEKYGSLNNPRDCRDADITASALSIFSKQVLDIIKKDNFFCENLSLPKTVCAARNRLQKADLEIQKQVKKLQEIADRDKDNYDWAIKNSEFVQKTIKESSIPVELSAEESKEFQDAINLKIEPDWQKFDPTRAKLIKQSYQKLRPILEKFQAAKQNQNQTDTLFADLKSKGFYEDLLIMQSCLIENKPNIPKTPKDQTDLNNYIQISKSYPERKFSEKDYEDARKCESSVSL